MVKENCGIRTSKDFQGCWIKNEGRNQRADHHSMETLLTKIVGAFYSVLILFLLSNFYKRWFMRGNRKSLVKGKNYGEKINACVGVKSEALWLAQTKKQLNSVRGKLSASVSWPEVTQTLSLSSASLAENVAWLQCILVSSICCQSRSFVIWHDFILKLQSSKMILDNCQSAFW